MRRSRRILLLGACLMVLGGCHRTLFPESAPRTQFEAYDTMRHGVLPMQEPDAFGHPQPALRNRLGQHRR